MTIEQKLQDEYRIGYLDGFAEGFAKGFAESYGECVKEAIIAINGLLEPTMIAECYQLPLEKVIDILNQA